MHYLFLKGVFYFQRVKKIRIIILMTSIFELAIIIIIHILQEIGADRDDGG